MVYMKRAALLVVLLCTGSIAGRCQESPNFITEPRESMRGLLGVNVATEHNGCGGIDISEYASVKP